MKPKRIQRKRIKGWKLPANTVSVTRPGKWGNPFKIGGYDHFQEEITTPQQAVNTYETIINLCGSPVTKDQIKKELKGKNLACFCPLVDKNGNHVFCHADILLKIANE